MALTIGKKLGPYEIQKSIGAGGMGEVYSAHDDRLNRTVAIKVLPVAFSSDRDRLNRFSQEARAAAALNHPNILSIYDIGEEQGAPYIVSELLDGETLRDRLRLGAVPMRKAIDYALQIARGLAAAHEKGIIHRDLKPENIFLTEDGRVKILDFGLAKLTRPESTAPNEATIEASTDPGIVMGTVGYMSPEQVRGKPADARSDIFAFGAILYEMISGKRAFHGETPADTMSAILKEEVPELSETARNVPPGLERIVRHCLEKSPAQRFHSANDLAFDLEALTDVSSSTKSAARAVAASDEKRQKRRQRSLLAASLFGAVLLAMLGWWLGRGSQSKTLVDYQQLTFRSGIIDNARFTEDGSVVYSAQFDGDESTKLYMSRPGEVGAHEIGIKSAQLLSVSKKGELAILVNERRLGGYARTGTLARVSLSGGTPREVLDNVQDATWTDDEKMAVVRYTPENGHWHLEFPVGKVLLDTVNWISTPDISGDGKTVAFIDHESPDGDDQGSVAVIGPDGKEKKLVSGFISIQGLHWSPDGKEVWYTGSRSGNAENLRGVTLSGKDRAIANFPGGMWLQDVRDGQALTVSQQVRVTARGRGPGAKEDKDLGWLGWSIISDLSRDGTKLLFEEEGDGGGPDYTVYLRDMDGSPPVKIANGRGFAISPDKAWVVTMPNKKGPLWLVPTGAGEARQITHDNIAYQVVKFFPDGKQLLAVGIEPGHGVRDYVVQVETGEVKPLTPEGISGARLSPDGRSVLVWNGQAQAGVWSIPSGTFRKIPGLESKYRGAGWTPDGKSVYVMPAGYRTQKMEVSKIDIVTGKAVPWKTIAIDAPAGRSVGFFSKALDSDAYVYLASEQRSVAYLVRGLK